MQSATNDLINTDYLVGLPLTYRHGSWATRLRLYHQSSHLGDEYLLHTNAQRVDLTFEAAELLVSKEIAQWRGCGGGGGLFAPPPAGVAARVGGGACGGRGEVLGGAAAFKKKREIKVRAE